jgi:hypothetical protein
MPIPRYIYGYFTCRKATTWDQWLYFPTEGRRAEDFFALKIRRLRPGANPRTWVPKDSTLPVVHRSRYNGKVSLRVRGKCGEILSMELIFVPSVLRPYRNRQSLARWCVNADGNMQ